MTEPCRDDDYGIDIEIERPSYDEDNETEPLVSGALTSTSSNGEQLPKIISVSKMPATQQQTHRGFSLVTIIITGIFCFAAGSFFVGLSVPALVFSKYSGQTEVNDFKTEDLETLNNAAKIKLGVAKIMNNIISAVSGAKEDGNRTKFLFLMGTEGSGHHLFNVTFYSSPVKKFLDEVGIDYLSIPKLLYWTGNPANGVFSSVISQEKHVDGSKIFRKLVDSLREVDRTVRSSSIPPPSADWFIPMNSIGYKGFKSGLMSYPNYGGKTKALQYPDLTVLYAACEEAGVVCKHMVLYRDAYEVVNSTMVHRNFYGNFRQGAKTLNSMASVIAMELLKFPDQTAGCWNYDNGTTVSEVARMLGWDPDGIVWKEQWSNIYQPTTPTKENQDELVPRQEKVYFSALLSSFQEIADLCETVLGISEDASL